MKQNTNIVPTTSIGRAILPAHGLTVLTILPTIILGLAILSLIILG